MRAMQRTLARQVAALFGVLCLLLPASAVGQATGGVDGRVVDAAGAPILGAVVEIGGSDTPLRTDADGRFAVRGLPPGTVAVFVRRLGFEPRRASTLVTGGTSVQITIRLAAAAAVLTPVRVTARREAFAGRLAGFNARRARGAGHIIGRERIDRANSNSLMDIIRTAPGVRIVRTGRTGPGEGVRFRGASCAPLLFIDGFPATAGEFDLSIIDLNTVEGIELYPSLASIPPEFLGPRGLDRCGVIAVWSRPFRSRTEPTGREVEASSLVSRGDVFAPDSVDTVAVLLDDSAAPVYPDSLWRTGVPGRVVAEFVVDTSGVVEMNTVIIISSSAPQFSGAVRDALALATFSPAIRQGRKVRQVVHQPFDFVPATAEGAGRPDVPDPSPS